MLEKLFEIPQNTNGGILDWFFGWWKASKFEEIEYMPKNVNDLLQINERYGPVVICASNITAPTSIYTSDEIDESSMHDMGAPSKTPHHAMLLLQSWKEEGGVAFGLYWDGDNTVQSPGLEKLKSYCSEKSINLQDVSTEDMDRLGGFSAGMYIAPIGPLLDVAEKASAGPMIIAVKDTDQ